MAEDNIGFDVNGGILETQFAVLAACLGSSVAVVETDAAAKVTAGATAMTVDVAPGPTYACGERHNITTIVNKSISAVTLSGATRYDAVVRRRNWSTNAVTTEVVEGTAAVDAQEVAPTLNNNPGVLHEQLLALVKATNGSTQLDILPRRVWASKFLTVERRNGLPPASATLHGAVAWVIDDKAVYRCLLTNGSPAWVSDTPTITELTGAAVLKTVQTGWTVDGTHVNRCIVRPYSRQLDLEFRRSGAEINAANADGNFTDSPIVVLQDACWPDRPMPVRIDYITTDGKEFGGDARLDPNGTLVLLGGAVARNLASSTAQGFVSLRASIRFDRRTA